MYYICFNGKSSESAITYYYMEIIAKAIERIGGEYKKMYSLPSKIEKDDVFVTLDPKTEITGLWKLKPKKIIRWYQGVAPEEFVMGQGMGKLNKAWHYLYASVLEFIALKFTTLNLFCSEGMLAHYKSKYGYKKNNYIIMPCMNESGVHSDVINETKYAQPTFVYAGSDAVWQCVEETILLFKKIKERVPESQLYLYIENKEYAENLLNKYDVDAIVDYVPKERLEHDLQSMKYGFLVRQDIVVNRVASPTKMSTYLSNGIIPIFSKCIGDYNKEIGKLEYSVPVGQNYDGIEKLFELEKTGIKLSDIKKEYESVFSDYYCSDKYIEKIATALKGL